MLVGKNRFYLHPYSCKSPIFCWIFLNVLSQTSPVKLHLVFLEMNCFNYCPYYSYLEEMNTFISLVKIHFDPLILFNLPLTHFLKAMAQSNIRYLFPKMVGGWVDH